MTGSLFSLVFFWNWIFAFESRAAGRRFNFVTTWRDKSGQIAERIFLTLEKEIVTHQLPPNPISRCLTFRRFNNSNLELAVCYHIQKKQHQRVTPFFCCNIIRKIDVHSRLRAEQLQ
jgi:hypothetical protein